MGWISDLLQEIPSAARYKTQLDDMEKGNASLKLENASLKSELDSLREELAALKSSPCELVLEAENILVFIAHHENATSKEITQALGMTQGTTDMYIEDLVASEYIDASYFIGQSPQYYIAQTGRRYLHARELL